VLAEAAERFASLGLDGPRLQAELLLAHVLRTDRLHLYTDVRRTLSEAELERYHELIERRAAGEPTQHLVGSAYFFGRAFVCDRRAMIPRPETEVLVEICLRELRADAPLEILDLCCGSGIIGLTLLADRPRYRADLSDLSNDAVELAAENARRLNIADRVQTLRGDLLAPHDPAKRWDCIVANPPYVRTAEISSLSTEVREHDPHLALDGGPDGLDFVRRIAAEARGRLRGAGLLALEIGDDQGPEASRIVYDAGWRDVRVWPDLARRDRVVTARAS
jgi:release factor glutamine methyltransferase